ncbi:methyl-accepting chemotaxis protein [Halanaerobium praevalens]|uniref:Methyl-accepting chemotaxis sensory transducer with Cache sensor n=1 Tax=Halanaerobium praevalens (strain ATCC 33744 / DSM 2228 / GSL) TaxID=572479 RepID=E3DMR4_HALPG|nr:methyl-accepting chemotaxis protein [Halanaerobium praevalens]ADO76388.1 methyl-accepting chemotaxis sensory transducer with Cache sensor [Halanaerobium praevalens DSM 2228]
MKWIRSSISRKVIFSILILFLITFSIYGYVLRTQIRSSFEKETEAKLMKDSQKIATEVNLFLERYMTIVNQMETNQDYLEILEDIENRANKREHPLYNKVVEQLAAIKNSDQNISLAYLGLGEASDLITQDYDYDADPDYQIRGKGWYQETIKAGNTIVTEPYVDGVTGGLIISVAKPVMQAGQDLGTLALDITLDDISKILSNYQVAETGYAILISKNGTIIYHPNEERVMNDNMSDFDGALGQAASSMQAGESGLINYEFNNEQRLMAFNPVANSGWSIGTLVPKDEIMVEGNRILFISLVLLIGAVLFTTILISLLLKKNLKPIDKILAAINNVAAGDLSTKVDLDQADEIGRIATALNQMTANMRSIIEKVADTATDLSASSEELSASGEEVASAAEEVGNAIQQVASGSEEQSAQVDQTNVMIKDLLEQIEEVENMSKQMDTQSNEVMENIKSGNQSIDNSVNEISSVKNNAEEVSKTINNLGELSTQIGDIVALINNIAAQTNLLALNAAIEAARAGEAGRGFSVVADEIRQLAEESENATVQINKLINKIGAGVDNAVDKMNNTEEVVNHSVEAIDETRNYFEEINSASLQLAEFIDNISSKSERVNLNANKVEEVVNEIAKVSEEAATNAEEVSASSEEQYSSTEEIVRASDQLAEMANELSESINKFKF